MVAADAGDGQYVAALLDGGEEPGCARPFKMTM
jgi:hypothetical protein